MSEVITPGDYGPGDYGNEFNDDSFWEKIKKFAVKAGKEVIKIALTLYYCLKDKDTPLWAKGVIMGALGYFIVPMDAIPDFIPVVGFADDLGALAAAAATVAIHIKPEHRQMAADKLKEWFGDNGDDETNGDDGKDASQ